MIVNQSAIDLIVCIFTIGYQYITDINLIPDGIYRELFCRLWLNSYLIGSYVNSSVYNLTVISFERWIAIKYPFKFESNQVKKRLPVVIVFTWIIGPALMLGFPLTSNVKADECSVGTEYASSTFRLIAVATNVCMDMVLPLVTMVVLYYQMWQVLKKSGKSDISNASEYFLNKAILLQFSSHKLQ